MLKLPFRTSVLLWLLLSYYPKAVDAQADTFWGWICALTLGLICFAPPPPPTTTKTPSLSPITDEPTNAPLFTTNEPTLSPTLKPTSAPTLKPTNAPTPDPTSRPTNQPSAKPTESPITEARKTWSIQLDLQVQEPDTQVFYERAAARWAEIIQTDVPDVDLTAQRSSLKQLPSPSCRYPDTIDDLYVCLYDGSIDGGRDENPNGGDILGFASVLYYRTSNRQQAAVAYAKFDRANIARLIPSGSFQTVVNHELGHGLGIGSLWTCPTTASSSNNANREFRQLSGCSVNAPTFGNGDESRGCAQ